jgi:thioredoxin 1
MSNLTPTSDARFTADVLESDVPVVVDFTAAWCPPCRMMDPILAELAQERPDLRFVSLDVDANHDTAARHAVLSMPTFMVFRAGAPVLKLIGARPKARLARELSEVVPEPEQVLVQQPAGG